MNPILERIKEAYRLETDAEVADFLGIKPSTLSMQKNRGRLNLHRIIEKCSDLNKNWLLDGNGKMRTEEELQSQNGHITIYSSLEIENQVPNLHKSIKAGTLFSDVTDELQQFSSTDHVIGYVVSGNSEEPTLSTNDIAIINLDSSPEENGVFLISANQKIFFSRVAKKTGSYILEYGGNNREQQNNHQGNFNTIGKLVWILRRIPGNLN